MHGDILLDDWDLDFNNGDIKVDEALIQRQQLIVGTSKNDWKQHPDMGVGAEGFIDDESDVALLSEIREQLRMDGLVAKVAKVVKGNLYINAE